MKLGLVVQRYGLDIAGGAELHCRLIAEHLSEQHQVEVFTTCARDYVTWKNEYEVGTERIEGVTVHRFPVRSGRSIRRFEDVQNLVFHGHNDREMEELWVRENGPYCPRLLRALKGRSDIDVWIMFSYRYWTTYHALHLHRQKALLVPTAEHDPALYLSVMKDLFSLPCGIIYNSVEERTLIQNISGNFHVPGDIVGVGLNESNPQNPTDPYFEKKCQELDPYILYIGRIDKNKGCDHLFRLFRRFYEEVRQDVKLVLIGKPVIPVPDHPGIKQLGFLSETEKTLALRHSRLLVMPSQYESLSMVLLEAWRESRPVLVNARCEVLNGQSKRSNGGLMYNNYDEFSGCLQYLIQHRKTADALGLQGHRYYSENYIWPIIMDKYQKLLAIVSSNAPRG